ncbi:MAG TPA: hypothetical protein VGK87_11940 [Anaerolineae bacterium]
MLTQQDCETNNQATDDQDGEFDELELDSAIDTIVYDGSEQEPPMSDEKHDRTVMLMAALIGVGIFVVLIGLTALSKTGIFGADCGPIPTNRSGRCYQAGFPNNQTMPYLPTSSWQLGHISIVFPSATPWVP